jgi:hypothetical protein
MYQLFQIYLVMGTFVWWWIARFAISEDVDLAVGRMMNMSQKGH